MSERSSAEGFERLADYAERARMSLNLPGLAVAVTDREHVLHLCVAGHADVAARTPVDPETLFEIGSISKSFTSLLVLQEVEAGRLDLHRPVVDYLPWFEVRSAYDPITLHHLLSHTAGIIQGSEAKAEATPEAWALRDTEAATPPGTHFHYSNVGYKALGLVLEAVTGKAYGDLVRSHILEPLGMRSTEPVITNSIREKMATGYEAFADDRPLPPGGRLAPATWLETATADGSIASTQADMAAYLRALMSDGVGPGGPLMSKETFALMLRPVIDAADPPHKKSEYAYGLNIIAVDGHRCVSHGGGMVGYSAHILCDLEAGIGAVVLSNGPGETLPIAEYALRVGVAVAAAGGADTPTAPDPPDVDPLIVPNAAEYAGSYGAVDGRRLDIVADRDGLACVRGETRARLTAAGPDAFFVEDPELDRFVLRFGRADGRVIEAMHGPDQYMNRIHAEARAFDHPHDWDGLIGHYRSHNPWFTNFRIVVRKGALWLVAPGGVEAPQDELPLVPLQDGSFRLGEDERSPERIRFDTILGGRANHAVLSGGDYYRTFTP